MRSKTTVPDVSKDFMHLFSKCKHDTINVLLAVKVSSEILQQNSNTNLTEKQHHLVALIERSCVRCFDILENCSQYLQLRYNPYQGPWCAVGLPEMIGRVVANCRQVKEITTVNVALPPHLPPVKAANDLHTVFSFLIAPHLSSDDEKRYNVDIQVQNGSPDIVQVRIKTGIPLGSPESPEFIQAFHPGGRLSIADLILKKHGSALDVEPCMGFTRFNFTLPVWKEE